MKLIKNILFASVLIAAFSVVGCKKDTPMENAGEAIKDAAEETGDAAKDAGDKIKDAVDK